MKQIYASLEFGEEKIRLLVGEYFNTRFNIIKLEEVACDGFKTYRIKDKEKVKIALKSAFDNAAKMIGTEVRSVILILPSYNMKRYSLKVTLPVNRGFLTKEDAALALSEAMKTKVDNDVIIANAVIIRYIVNGISSRRFPEREICEEFSCDIDLLCADKTIAFEYASLLDECGIKIMDICLDSYAIGKEASLYERTLNRNLILLNINNYSTILSLISKGKLISSDYIFEGLNQFKNMIKDNYDLPDSTIDRLLKYNSEYDETGKESIIYAWTNDKKESFSITAKNIHDLIFESLTNYINKIALTCEPIIANGETEAVIVGQGASMNTLVDGLRTKLEIPVKAYFPDTIGIRDSVYTALYGSFFVLRDNNDIKQEEMSSIDLFELDNIIRRKTPDSEAETLTSKIKSLFNTSKEDKE